MEICCGSGALTGAAKLKQLLPRNCFKLAQKFAQNQNLSLPMLILKTPPLLEKKLWSSSTWKQEFSHGHGLWIMSCRNHHWMGNPSCAPNWCSGDPGQGSFAHWRSPIHPGCTDESRKPTSQHSSTFHKKVTTTFSSLLSLKIPELKRKSLVCFLGSRDSWKIQQAAI